MWDAIVLIPDHCLSIYSANCTGRKNLNIQMITGNDHNPPAEPEEWP